MAIGIDLELLVGRWPEPPLAEPPGRMSYGAEEDDPTPGRVVRLASDLEGMTIGIVYRDMKDRPSERTIRCDRLLSDDGILYINAFCKMRKAQRTFRLDRVVSVIDYSTGEVIEDVAGFFGPFIGDLRPIEGLGLTLTVTVPSRAEGPMLQLYGAGATVLAYVAGSDGHIHLTEMARIEQYVDLKLGAFREDDLQFGLSRQWLRNLLPDRAMAVKAMRKVVSDPDGAALVAEALIDLIAADGDVTDDEMAAARDMIEILSRKERKAARVRGD